MWVWNRKCRAYLFLANLTWILPILGKLSTSVLVYRFSDPCFLITPNGAEAIWGSWRQIFVVTDSPEASTLSWRWFHGCRVELQTPEPRMANASIISWPTLWWVRTWEDHCCQWYQHLQLSWLPNVCWHIRTSLGFLNRISYVVTH